MNTATKIIKMVRVLIISIFTLVIFWNYSITKDHSAISSSNSSLSEISLIATAGQCERVAIQGDPIPNYHPEIQDDICSCDGSSYYWYVCAPQGTGCLPDYPEDPCL